ncbi:nicotinamidase [Tupanvirus soda lake]|uniref:nicotinamidase n=2 Tax=Tupanvirus TaxID=2094720 RepID=A0A6N1NNM5_9VIRU|nr:nicotinamidase [Tupanvirus soda lake]QKU35954.1 nicotinamidase [Tupanvirus soda lake]
MDKIALLVIDMQNDFVSPNGKLFVKDADKIVIPISQLINNYNWGLVVFSQDWHPQKHVSFEIFPPHCVQNTIGADIVSALKFDNIVQTQIKKGYDYWKDSYSAFMDADRVDTGLDQILKSRGIKYIYIVGVAYDYCVYYTAVDGIALGYNVTLLKFLTKSIDPTKENKITDKLTNIGVNIIN